MIKIRLALHGSKKKPFYQIVVADNRFPRNGRFIENVGFFNPNQKNKLTNFFLKMNRIEYWINNGAILSNRTKYLIKYNNKIKLK